MRLLVQILLLFILKSAFSQEIIYDFKTKKFDSKITKIGEGKEFSIKVKNVNLYLYNVEIFTKSQVYNTTPPKILQEIFGASSINELVSKAIEVKSGDNLIEKNVSSPESKTPNELDDFLGQYSFIQKIDAEYSFKILKAYDTNGCLVNESISCSPDKIKELLSLPIDFEKKYYSIISNKSIDSLTKAIVIEIKKEYDLQVYKAKFKEYIKFLLNYSDENFSFTSGCFEAEGDEMQVSIVIKPRQSDSSSNFLIPLKSDSVGLNLLVSSTQWKISFSSGVFVTKMTGGNEYAYKPMIEKDTVSFYNIVEEKKSTHTIGISSMAHFMKPMYIGDIPNIKGGFHLGVGVPLEKKFTFFLQAGLSLALGRKERIILNYGIVGGLVNKPSNGINLVIKYKDTALPINYARVFDYRSAISVTFNVFDIK